MTGGPDWLAPTSLEEALEHKAQLGEEATVLAGGTFLGILMNQGFLRRMALNRLAGHQRVITRLHLAGAVTPRDSRCRLNAQYPAPSRRHCREPENYQTTGKRRLLAPFCFQCICNASLICSASAARRIWR